MMISCNHVSKKVARNFELSGIDFTVPNGETVGIIGPNGSGKTTLMKLIAGINNSDEGEILLGVDKTKVRFMLEELGIPKYYKVQRGLNVFKHITRSSTQEISSVIELLGLNGHEKKLVRNLSQGLKQRLNIACTLMGDASLYLFDEPNNGLDPHGFILLRKIISNLKLEGKNVIIASHLLSEVEKICDSVLIMDKGQLYGHEKVSDLVTKYGSLEEAYMSYTSH